MRGARPVGPGSKTGEARGARQGAGEGARPDKQESRGAAESGARGPVDEWAEENPGSGRGAAAGLWPPQKSMGVPA